MALVEDDDVIQELSAKATDHAFNIGILPRRSRRGDDDRYLENRSFAERAHRKYHRRLATDNPALYRKGTLQRAAVLSTVQSDVPSH